MLLVLSDSLIAWILGSTLVLPIALHFLKYKIWKKKEDEWESDD